MNTDTGEVNTLSPKEQQWQHAVDKINKIEDTDPHGLKIDTQIKRTVIGLNALGFDTTFSCEGHLDHGKGYPYI